MSLECRYDAQYVDQHGNLTASEDPPSLTTTLPTEMAANELANGPIPASLGNPMHGRCPTTSPEVDSRSQLQYQSLDDARSRQDLTHPAQFNGAEGSLANNSMTVEDQIYMDGALNLDYPFFSDVWDWGGNYDPFLITSHCTTGSDMPLTVTSSVLTEVIANFEAVCISPGLPAVTYDERASAMLRQPLPCRHYDQSMLDVLIHICKQHVFCFLRSFESFAEHCMPNELRLGMAALGALLSKIPDCETIAAALFIESQRIILTTILTANNATSQELRLHIQTLIVLELYAICGGDKRAAELAYSFHQTLFETVKAYCKSATNASDTEAATTMDFDVVVDVFFIQSYRTILFREQPLITPFSLPSIPLPMNEYGTPPKTLILHLQALLDYSPRSVQAAITVLDLGCLASIYHASRGIYRSTCYEAIARDYNPHLVYTFLSRASLQLDATHRWLCHLAVINLYAPLEEMSEAVRYAVHSRGRAVELRGLITNWRQSVDARIAIRHAQQLLKELREAAVNAVEVQVEVGRVEAPHECYAAYIAALVLLHTMDDHSVSSTSHEATVSVIRNAVGILAKSRLPVASKMGRTLQEYEGVRHGPQ